MLKKTTLKFWLSLAIIVGLGVLLCACAGNTSTQGPEEWRPTIANCWCCALYGTTFEVINTFVTAVIKAVIPAARFILGVGLLFVLLQRIGSTMIFMEDKQALAIWKELGIVFLKVIVVSAILYSPDEFLYALKYYVIYQIQLVYI